MLFKTIPFMLLLVAFMFAGPLASTNSPWGLSDNAEIVVSLCDGVLAADLEMILVNHSLDFAMCPVEVGVAPCSCSFHRSATLMRGTLFTLNQYRMTQFSHRYGNREHSLRLPKAGEARAGYLVLC